MIPIENYQDIFRISSEGLFEILSVGTSIQNYKVYVSIFNGEIWSDSEVVGAIADVTINSEPIVLPNQAPKFVLEPEDISVEIPISGDSTQKISLPEAFDPNNDEFTIEVIGLQDYMTFDEEDFSINVDESRVFADKDDEVEVILTDSQGGTQSYKFNI